MTNPVPISNNIKFSNFTVINRQPFACHLLSFLNTKAEEGYVLNLNAEWGAGKTTFLHCWYNELSEKHPVVYFDAWKSDFSKDAMLALIECLHHQLTSPIPKHSELINEVFEKGSYFIRKSIPYLVAGYLKHKTGTDSDESLLKDWSEEFDLNIGTDEIGDGIKAVLKELVEQRKRVEGINEFREKLEQLAEAVIKCQQETHYPVYVLIDELDRCRPNYAIEVIENIKHFFNTKHFIFVIATDTEQLQHSIKAIYSNDFDAYSYLSRFFDKSVTLPPPSTEEFIRSRLNPIIENDFSLEDPIIINLITSIFDWHNITSLREMDKIIQDIEVARVTQKKFSILPLIVLSLLKRLSPKHYIAFTKSNLIPYRGSDTQVEPNHPNFLPRNNNIPYALEGKNCHQPVESVINSILLYLRVDKSNHQYFEPFNKVISKTFESRRHKNAVNTICHTFSLNPSGNEASIRDYISTLELAGHFI